MNYKKTLKIAGICILVFIIGYVGLHFYAKYKISSALDNKVKKGELSYTDFNLNLWSGTVKFDSIHYQKKTMEVSATSFSLIDLSYSKFLFDKEIVIDEINIQQPVIHYIKKKNKDSAKKSTKSKSGKPILIKNVSVNDGRFTMRNDSIELLSAEKFNLNAENIAVDSISKQQKIPFTYKKFQFSVANLAYDLNKLQKLQLQKLSISEKNVNAFDLVLLPKLSRKEYVEVIPYEKDLMKLKVDSLAISNYNFTFQDEIPVFKSPLMKLSGLDFNIYRDKTVKNDTRKKALYSKMLRELSLKLAIDSLQISGANITYEELIKKDRDPGKVVFENLNANIANVTNLDLDRENFPETNIDISTSFMGKSPLDVQWNFKVNDTTDYFTIKGSSFSIPPPSINSFFKPAFNMRATGSGIEEVYFNFSGNSNQARGQLKLVYDKFKVEVLQKDGKKKNTILSIAANLLVNKKPKDGSITEHVEGVKRDKTKSFWNYFWSCLQAGLKKSLI